MGRYLDLVTEVKAQKMARAGAPGMLAALKAAGITLSFEQGGVRCDGPTGALTEELRQGVKTYKRELLKLVTAPPADAMRNALCATCGSQERWQRIDGRLLCRVCVVLDLADIGGSRP